MNDGGSFSFRMEWGDISLFDLGWDFATDLHTVASTEQAVDISALS